MARRPFTLRIDEAEHTALKELSKVEKRSINQLLNDAIKAYLSKQGPRERDLEATLGKLQAYRRRDPGFKRAIAGFVDGEAGLLDPVEGKPVEGRLVDGQLKPVGPVQGEVRALLDA